jgi:hypothetical protein
VPPRLLLALRLMRAAVAARYPAAAVAADDLLGDRDGGGSGVCEGAEGDWSEFIRSMSVAKCCSDIDGGDGDDNNKDVTVSCEGQVFA